MQVEKTAIAGVRVITPRVFADERGFFLESYQGDRYAAAGVPAAFVQDNHSRSSRGVLRGLHYQVANNQAQMVYLSTGAIFDVVVDLRRDSPTFGQWAGFELTADNHRQLYMPPGCAHGFLVLSDSADIHYKCTRTYAPDDEGGVAWNDPDIAIIWPLNAAKPILANRDAAFPRLRDIPAHRLPVGTDSGRN